MSDLGSDHPKSREPPTGDGVYVVRFAVDFKGGAEGFVFVAESTDIPRNLWESSICRCSTPITGLLLSTKQTWGEGIYRKMIYLSLRVGVADSMNTEQEARRVY